MGGGTLYKHKSKNTASPTDLLHLDNLVFLVLAVYVQHHQNSLFEQIYERWDAT